MDPIEVLMEIGLLAQCSPVETYSLVMGQQAQPGRILMLTLLNLHLSKRLRLAVVGGTQKKGKAKAAPFKVRIGLKREVTANEEQPKEVDYIWLKPFKNDLEIEYSLLQYFEALHIEIGSLQRFDIQSWVKTGALEGLYRPSGWRQFFGASRKLTAEGKVQKAQTISILESLEHLLPSLFKNDPAKAKEVLSTIGGNVLLLRAASRLQGEAGKEFLKSVDHSALERNIPYAIDRDYLLCFEDRFLQTFRRTFNQVLCPPQKRSIAHTIELDGRGDFGVGCSAFGGE